MGKVSIFVAGLLAGIVGCLLAGSSKDGHQGLYPEVAEDPGWRNELTARIDALIHRIDSFAQAHRSTPATRELVPSSSTHDLEARLSEVVDLLTRSVQALREGPLKSNWRDAAMTKWRGVEAVIRDHKTALSSSDRLIMQPITAVATELGAPTRVAAEDGCLVWLYSALKPQHTWEGWLKIRFAGGYVVQVTSSLRD